jgi:hypothetical protein
MANSLYFPFINPVKFYLPTPSTLYHTRHIDDFEFFDSIPEWSEQVDYIQPWEKTDKIRLQFQADFGPWNFVIKDLDGNVINTIAIGSLPNLNNPDLNLYQQEIDLSPYDDGGYRFFLQGGVGTPLILQSNKQEICTQHKHSILFDVKNYEYHEGVVFETGIRIQFRVEGAIKFKSPAFKDQSFEDQPLDQSLLNSIAYRIHELILGDAAGVPDYVPDIVNRLLSCTDVKIDGRQYAKNDGAKWESNELENYELRGWKIEMRPSLNRPAMVYTNSQPINARFAVVANADTKGFDSSASGTVIPLINVE